MQTNTSFIQTWKKGVGGGIFFILPSLSVDFWLAKEQKNIDIEFKWLIWSAALELTWG